MSVGKSPVDTCILSWSGLKMGPSLRLGGGTACMAITSDLSSGVATFHIAALGRNMGGIPVPEIPSKAGRRGPNSPVRDRLDVLPGIDGRAGRRADARRRLMIGKRDSVRLFHSRPGTGNGQASKKCSWSTRMNRMLYPPSGVSGGDHCCAGAVAIVPARITSGNTLAPSRARRDGWATRSDESVICVSGRGSQFL